MKAINNKTVFNYPKWLLLGLIPIIGGLSIVACKYPIIFGIAAGVLVAIYLALNVKVCIIFLALWLPFQDFVLKWIPPSLFLSLRWSSDALVTMLFIGMCSYKFIKGETLRKTVIDLPLVGFLLVVLSSALWNGSTFLDSLIWLFPLLRYILLFYVILNLKIDEKYIKKVIHTIGAILLIQIIIGCIQFFASETVNNLLAPQSIYSWQIGNVEREIYPSFVLSELKGKFLFSTFDNGNLYGGFLVVNIFILIGLYRGIPLKDFIRLTILGAGIFVIFFTYSRQAWLALYFGLFAIAIAGNKKPLLFLLLGIFIFVFIVIGIYKFVGSPYTSMEEITFRDRFYSIFSEPFFGSTRDFGRSYVFIDGSIKIIENRPWLGVGPGAAPDDFVNKLGFSLPGAIMVGDVGWVDMFSRVGLIGLSLFLWMLSRLFFHAKNFYNKDIPELSKGICLGYIGCLFGMFVLTFPSVHFHIRTTSYYFWLYGGLLFNLINASSKRNGDEIKSKRIDRPRQRSIFAGKKYT